MTIYYLCPISSIFQYFNDLGIPLSGGKINTYTAGSSTPQATYTDITGGTTNANPIILANNGRLNNVQVWQPGGSSLKIVLSDTNNNQIGPVFDQVTGVNDPATTLATLANPNSGFGVDIVANAVRSYDLFASMRSAPVPSLSGSQTLTALVQGGATLLGGGGAFRWSTTSTAADDSFSVIKPATAGGTGRWLRIVEPMVSTGLFQGTLTGMTAATTATFLFTRYNVPDVTAGLQMVNLYVSGTLTGTSNLSSMSLTGLPSLIWPAATRSVMCSQITDNGALYVGKADVGTSGGVGIALLQVSGSNVTYSLNAFTASGTKGLGAGWYISYNL